jgi:hypothetical protein
MQVAIALREIKHMERDGLHTGCFLRGHDASDLDTGHMHERDKPACGRYIRLRCMRLSRSTRRKTLLDALRGRLGTTLTASTCNHVHTQGGTFEGHDVALKQYEITWTCSCSHSAHVLASPPSVTGHNGRQPLANVSTNRYRHAGASIWASSTRNGAPIPACLMHQRNTALPLVLAFPHANSPS